MRFLFYTVVLLFAFSGSAQESLNYTDRLHFTWARIPLGELTLAMQQAGNHYSMRAEGKTQGIVALFNQHQSVTQVEGRVAGYVPKHYQSDYVDNGDKRLIAIDYDKKGQPIKEEIIPPREEIRPLVPAEQKIGSVDILTGFFLMREKVRAALREKQQAFAVTIYDGKRLFRVDATLSPTLVNVRLHGKKRPAIKMSLQRVPLAGYKEKELKRLKERNPPVLLYVEPERLVPFGLAIKVYGATLEAWVD